MIAGFSPSPTLGSELELGDLSYGGRSIAQPFIAGSASVPKVVVANLKRTGPFTPNSHTLTATIEGDLGGSPNSIAIATSTPIDVSTLSDTATYYSFNLSTSTTLVKDQVYWVRIRASYPVGNSSYISWLAYDGRQGGYFNGQTALGAKYEQSTVNIFSNALIGEFRFLLFTIKC